MPHLSSPPLPSPSSVLPSAPFPSPPCPTPFPPLKTRLVTTDLVLFAAGADDLFAESTRGQKKNSLMCTANFPMPPAHAKFFADWGLGEASPVDRMGACPVWPTDSPLSSRWCAVR